MRRPQGAAGLHLLWLLAVLTACSGEGDTATAGEGAAPAGRIVSLAPHLTELAYSAGAGSALVGTVEHSNYPDAARELPRVGDAFRLDFERIAALGPDLVLAWHTGNPVRSIERIEELGLQVVVIDTSRLQDIAATLRRIGELSGTAATAERAAVDFERSLAALRERYAPARRVSVFYQISLEPLYTINDRHLISELLATCGGRNVFADLRELAPAIGIEAVLARDPEVILAPQDAGAEALEFWRRWPDLAAVRAGNLIAVDADRVSRATVRTLEGIEEVCRALDAARDKREGARTSRPATDARVSRAPRGLARDARGRARRRTADRTGGSDSELRRD